MVALLALARLHFQSFQRMNKYCTHIQTLAILERYLQNKLWLSGDVHECVFERKCKHMQIQVTFLLFYYKEFTFLVATLLHCRYGMWISFESDIGHLKLQSVFFWWPLFVRFMARFVC